MRGSWLLGAVVALGLSSAGNAASITILSPGDLGPPAGYGPGATFDSVSAQGLWEHRRIWLVLRRGSGFLRRIGSRHEQRRPGSLGLYATPFGDPTNYMAILLGGSEDIVYSSLKNSFGLYWGSVDTLAFA